VRATPALYALVDEERLVGRATTLDPGLDDRLRALLAPYAADPVAGGGLDRALSHLALWGSAEDEGHGATRRVLTLSTCHSAKGLEFERVIVVGAHDGAFPDFRDKTDEDRQESRRLLYVGLTRAEEHLVVMHAARSARGYPQKPTPFLRRVPPALVQHARPS
jgi:superfamily I DNA/RNA helicase